MNPYSRHIKWPAYNIAWPTKYPLLCHLIKQKQRRRAAAKVCPRPFPPSVGAEAPRAAEPTAPADDNLAVGSHAQYVPMLTAAAA